MDDDKLKVMVETFQCPGCVAGGDTSCGVFEPETGWSHGACKSHVAGTLIMPGGKVYLGMPKGFNRVGVIPYKRDGASASNNVRLWAAGTDPGWDRLNVAVWAMEVDGHLFVRTFAPRVGQHFVDVVEGGTMALVPNAINVGDFIDEID